MAGWSPTLEGFRSIFRRPAVPLAEVIWRWSFGAGAVVLTGLCALEYLQTLPVSRTDLMMLRTGHPALVSSALSHMTHGSAFQLMLALVILLSFLTLLWILIATVGRTATLNDVIPHIRRRAHSASDRLRGETENAATISSAVIEPANWGFVSLSGLHFLRAALALAACIGFLGAEVVAGLASSKTYPDPPIASLLALTLILLVWTAWSSISGLLSIASIFVVGQGQDTFRAFFSSIELCRERAGPMAAVVIWFGLAHLVVFVLATSVVTFPLTFAPVLPMPFVLATVLVLTLVYFAAVDTLSIGRMAGFVAIVEAPVTTATSPRPGVDSTQHSAASTQPQTDMVDQNELILSDRSQTPPQRTEELRALQTQTTQVDQNERMLSDGENI